MLMLIAVTVLQIVFDHVQEVPVGVSVFAGPTVAAVTLAVVTGFALRASRTWRPWSLLIGMGAGCIVAALFGRYDVKGVAEAPWVGIPLDGFPRFDLAPDTNFAALHYFSASSEVPRPGYYHFANRGFTDSGHSPTRTLEVHAHRSRLLKPRRSDQFSATKVAVTI